MKDEGVDIVHLKIHIILVILEFLVELAIQGDEENESNL